MATAKERQNAIDRVKAGHESSAERLDLAIAKLKRRLEAEGKTGWQQNTFSSEPVTLTDCGPAFSKLPPPDLKPY